MEKEEHEQDYENMNGWGVADVLIKRPELIEELKPFLGKLDKGDWEWLLEFLPQLKKFRKMKKEIKI